MNGDFIEAALHVQAMRLVCKALADREQQGIEVDWCVLRQMYDQMDAMLQALQHKHRYDSSEIVDLRKDRDAARAEIETLRGAMAADDKRLRDAEARVWPERTLGCDAPDAMADEILHLRQQLNAAQAAVTLQRAGIERLHKFVGKVRLAMWPEDIKSALVELDAGTEPAPVAEPRPCPECERLRLLIDKVNGIVNRTHVLSPRLAEIAMAIEEFDDNTLEPTPVAETLDAEGGA